MMAVDMVEAHDVHPGDACIIDWYSVRGSFVGIARSCFTDGEQTRSSLALFMGIEGKRCIWLLPGHGLVWDAAGLAVIKHVIGS